MRTIVRYAVFVMLAGTLTACSAATAAGKAAGKVALGLPSSHPATPAPAGTASSPAGPASTPAGTASSTPAVATGPVGVLPIPTGVTPWKGNTNAPMKLNAFVKAFYVQSAWTGEESLYTQRGFVTGAIEGWINADNSQQSIAVIKFSSPAGAQSQFDGLSATLRNKPQPATVVTDPTDGAVGTVDPTLDSLGNALVDITARVGDYVIDVHEFTPAKPDPAAAKALLLEQYNSLKGGT